MSVNDEACGGCPNAEAVDINADEIHYNLRFNAINEERRCFVQLHPGENNHVSSDDKVNINSPRATSLDPQVVQAGAFPPVWI